MTTGNADNDPIAVLRNIADVEGMANGIAQWIAKMALDQGFVGEDGVDPLAVVGPALFTGMRFAFAHPEWAQGVVRLVGATEDDQDFMERIVRWFPLELEPESVS